MSFATLCIVSPVCKNVTEQHDSTTCKPRNVEPSASAMVLPCSLEIFSAILL